MTGRCAYFAQIKRQTKSRNSEESPGTKTRDEDENRRDPKLRAFFFLLEVKEEKKKKFHHGKFSKFSLKKKKTRVYPRDLFSRITGYN